MFGCYTYIYSLYNIYMCFHFQRKEKKEKGKVTYIVKCMTNKNKKEKRMKQPTFSL